MAALSNRHSKLAAQPASAARTALHASAAVAPALAAVAAIGPYRSFRQQPGSYAVHPAVLDSATHTAAVFSAASPSEAASAVIRIPVALEAYSTAVAARPAAGSDVAAGSGKWCSGALEALRPDGSVLTSVSLGGGAARLLSFQAKVRFLTTCSLLSPLIAHGQLAACGQMRLRVEHEARACFSGFPATTSF